MRPGHLELFVRDPQRTKRFYRDVLGFSITSEQGDGRFVWLRHGEREILLRPGTPPVAATYDGAGRAQVVYADDVEAARTRIEEHDCVFRGTDGSDACLTFTDPDGYWFQLVDPGGH